jgi:hypothetical protein
MARISTYSIDQVITENDKWIGTDSSGSVTKNFTTKKIGEYFNETGSLGIANQVSFKYYTTFNGVRPEGSITLPSYQPAFSGVSVVKVNKKSISKKLVLEFLDALVDTEIIISDITDPNSFGKYELVSMEQDVVETDFYDLYLNFIEGNGSFAGGAIYSVSFNSYVIVNDKHFMHIQGLASTEWDITHNLNKFPSVSVIDSDNKLVIGEIQYQDPNNLKITFSGSFSGKAYLN